MQPLCIDLFCGLWGWGQGFALEGYKVVGYDLENACATFGRPVPEDCELIIQDVRTIDGARFKDATVIVASPPCQFFSYTAMPWTRAKKIAEEVRNDPARLEKQLELFRACFRIQREASEAAGHKIPLIVENVSGAQKWVGKAAWRFGSYYLWGDVPVLMPMTRNVKQPGRNFHFPEKYGITSPSFHGHNEEPSVRAAMAIKNTGGSWFNIAHNTDIGCGNNPDGRKIHLNGNGCGWFAGNNKHPLRQYSSKSFARKRASALIAKIPVVLSKWIAKCYMPADRKDYCGSL